METTVTLPPDEDGGARTATLRDPKERSVRVKRPLQLLYSQLGRARMNQIVEINSTIAQDLDDEERGAAVEMAMHGLGLSEAEWELLYRTTDATIFSYLKAWSMDSPLPRHPDEVADLVEDVYLPLSQAAAKIEAGHLLEDGFDVGSIENAESPTGVSVD